MSIATEKTPSTRKTDDSLFLFAIAGVAGLYEMIARPVPFGNGFEMVALGENLARSAYFANPFTVLATGPTAANPPLYPLLLALLFKVLSSTVLVAFAATLATILANAATAMLLPRASEMFYGDRRPGIIAGVFWIVIVPLWPCWDVSFTVLVLLIFCLKTHADLKKTVLYSPAFISGLLASALFLFNPSTILITIPWLAWLLYERRPIQGRVAVYCGFVMAVMIATGAVWELRNYFVLGGAVVRTNLGMTLYASNNDCASPSLIASEANNCYDARHPNTNIGEAKLIRSMGEVKYDQMRIQDSKVWIESHPNRFMALTIDRFRDFWLPMTGEGTLRSTAIWIATLLSIPGLLMMIRQRMKITVFLGIVILIYPLMYYVVVSSMRYRLPILWLSLLPCGWFLVNLWDRRFARGRQLLA
jgi:hypothetical protein